MLHQSIRVQNNLYRKPEKKKNDVCTSLGRSYKYYANSSSTVDQLFDEPTFKKMRQDLKHSSERKSSLSTGRAQKCPTRATEANSNPADRINSNSLTKETTREAAKRIRGKSNMVF